MKRCRHRNVSINEEYRGWMQHSVIDGSVLHNRSEGDLTGVIKVSCYDCGYCRKFTHKNRPKWVEDLLERMLEVEDCQSLDSAQ